MDVPWYCHSFTHVYISLLLDLYRDDGLSCLRNISGPQSNRIRKDIIKTFKEKLK